MTTTPQDPMQPDATAHPAWHLLRADGRLRDDSVPPADGEWLVYDGPVVPCESGLHASERALDALRYAPYGRVVVCRVELRGVIVAHGEPEDKLAASERRILWRLAGDDADRALHAFARWCALQALDLWDAPRFVRKYLTSGTERLRHAAANAAWDAVRSPASSAARSAAGATDAAGSTTTPAARAAEDAARSAALAASYAARDAAESASASDVAWGAIRDAQNTELERRLYEAHERSRT